MMKLVVAAVLATAGMTAPAVAQDNAHRADDMVTYSVPVADLDLTSEAGVVALDRRLNSAVIKVCVRNGVRGLAALQAEQSCKIETRAAVTRKRDALIASSRGQDRVATRAAVTRKRDALIASSRGQDRVATR
jgi:UrcA family protein